MALQYPIARNAVWIYTLCDGDRLIAYAIFCRRDVPDVGLRRIRLLDYQSLDSAPNHLLSILAEALERCRREGISVLESVGWGLESGDVMDRIAPYFRIMPSWQYFYKAGSPELASALRERRSLEPVAVRRGCLPLERRQR